MGYLYIAISLIGFFILWSFCVSAARADRKIK